MFANKFTTCAKMVDEQRKKSMQKEKCRRKKWIDRFINTTSKVGKLSAMINYVGFQLKLP